MNMMTTMDEPVEDASAFGASDRTGPDPTGSEPTGPNPTRSAQDIADPAASDRGVSDPTGTGRASPRTLLDRSVWFRNLSVRGKVHTIFAAFFGISFAMALILGLGLSELWLRYTSSTRANDALIETVELRSLAGDLRYNSARFLFAGEDVILERQRSGYEDAGQRIDAIESVVADAMPSHLPKVEQMRSDLNTYNSAFVTLITAQSQGAEDERVSLLGQRLAGHGEHLIEESRKLADSFVAQRERSQQAGLTYFTYMISALIALAALAAIVLAMGLRYLSVDVSAKISEISRGMTRLAKGERDFSIEGHDRKDELGDMLRALAMFKRANEQLEVWARERSEHAEEEIRLQREREAERSEAETRKAALLRDVAEQFERTVGDVVNTVATASSELGATASKMASSAKETSERTSTLAQNMEDANLGATSAAAASDEFALSIEEISNQAASSSAMARLAHDATQEADMTISALSDSAEQVGQIVELIQTIAQRTNLLALNASIEAARGGEAGRGFAVVASEVKELAMQTSRATEKVADQICAMQDKTGASVSALKAIAEQVRDLDATTIAIASAVNQQSVAGQDLARNIDLAARGTDEVAGHVVKVRELSLSTGAAANQVLSSANELESQASTLSAQVRSFLSQVRQA